MTAEIGVINFVRYMVHLSRSVWGFPRVCANPPIPTPRVFLGDSVYLLMLNMGLEKLAKHTAPIGRLNKVIKTCMMSSQTSVVVFFMDSWFDLLALITQHCDHDLHMQGAKYLVEAP